MNYYYDCEFLEGKQTHNETIFEFWIGKKRPSQPTIDMISIGIVSEDGREYYAISKDFNLKEAWNRYQTRTCHGDRNNADSREYWIRENVLRPIFEEFFPPLSQQNVNKEFTYSNMKWVLERYGKTNKQIATDIVNFTWGDKYFYGYYSAYDHVVLCWLFGKMIDLPKGFPMYTIDLKQELDRKVKSAGNCSTDESFQLHLRCCKKLPGYPKQETEHNALSDARWNKGLHEFINKL